MTEVINRNAKLIIYFLSFLLSCMVAVSGWSKYESSQTARDLVKLERNLPREYVTYRQYTCDMERLEKLLLRMEDKLDSVIMERE